MAILTSKQFHKEFLFIHIPRTAGRFIEANLLSHNGFTWNNTHNLSSMYGTLHGIEYDHFHREYYEKYLPSKNIPHVTIIRNPIDRFLSASSFLTRMYGDCQKQMENEYYFFSLLEHFPLSEAINWFRPQIDFISPNTHIWKYENNFTEPFSLWLSNILNIPITMNPNIEYTRAPDIGYKLKRTAPLINNIERLYEKDMEWYS